VTAGDGWESWEHIGWREAGAMRLTPKGTKGTLETDYSVDRPLTDGRLILAVRGPLGSTISAGGKTNTVAQNMTENPDEGPVRRYLDKGVAAISVMVDMSKPLEIEVDGDELYVMPSTEAVWVLHGSGVLRNVHYYQILNQVENQVWAQEMLEDRWVTLHQPPAWSPILSVATLLIAPDITAANTLFLFVILLVGVSAIRLTRLLVPLSSQQLHPLVWTLPAGLVASHGLLMFEPASTNFPDSLYAASVAGVAISLADGGVKRFSIMGITAGLLRWPGVFVATVLAVCWRLVHGHSVNKKLLALYSFTGLMVTAGVTLTLFGEISDSLFILYFETFPEHWHGNYQFTDLISRVPNFYYKWITYTGGAILAAIVATILSVNSQQKRNASFLILSAIGYSLVLCTVDHHPTPYFLPLVVLSGPALISSLAAMGNRRTQIIIVTFCNAFLWITLWKGSV